MPNRGGFSWNRALGITKAKQNFSRRTGLPLTKSGRERKLGKMMTGGNCCLIPTLFFVFLIILIMLM
jgi:hypothetical protein